MKKMALLSMQIICHNPLKLIWLASPRRELVVVRMIHAAGMIGLAPLFGSQLILPMPRGLPLKVVLLYYVMPVWSAKGSPARLPADNQVICTLQDPQEDG